MPVGPCKKLGWWHGENGYCLNRVASGQGKVREIQGQGKVREFCNWSGKFGILRKVREFWNWSGKFDFLMSYAQ